MAVEAGVEAVAVAVEEAAVIFLMAVVEEAEVEAVAVEEEEEEEEGEIFLMAVEEEAEAVEEAEAMEEAEEVEAAGVAEAEAAVTKVNRRTANRHPKAPKSPPLRLPHRSLQPRSRPPLRRPHRHRRPHRLLHPQKNAPHLPSLHAQRHALLLLAAVPHRKAVPRLAPRPVAALFRTPQPQQLQLAVSHHIGTMKRSNRP